MNTPIRYQIPDGPLRRRSISGGIKPALHKTASLRSRIMPMPLPPDLILPLNQYRGPDAIPVVNVGDQVLKYQLIARAASSDCLHVHAPTSGVVSALTTATIAGHPGNSAACILINCDGADKALDLQGSPAYQELAPADLLQKIDTAAVCGMGGAGFPAAEKIRLAALHGTELLIINAAECEPYISTDEALLRERAEQVVIGADILRMACHAPRCVIAIEDDKLDAIQALRSALAHSAIELLLLHSKYPTGGEKQIVQAVTGMEVPVGKFATDLGILVHNVGTAYATYQAVIKGMPSISRITTLTGAALQTPKNFEALIGTRVAFLLELCGVDKSRLHTTILGGSLMGIELASIDVAITKTSNCLIAATQDELPPAPAEIACIRCGYCADVCPAQLLPQQLYAYARAHNHEQLQAHGLDDCIECGACAYACPSFIPLVHYYVAAKQELHNIADRRVQSEHWKSRFQLHQYRIRKENENQPERRQRRHSVVSAMTQETGAGNFSREQAKQEIADAVARSKSRKAKIKATELPNHSPIAPPEPEEHN